MKIFLALRTDNRVFILLSSFIIAFTCAGIDSVCGNGIFQLIKENTSQELIGILKNGEDPNKPLENGMPPIVLAWQLGHINIFENLLEMGASTNHLIAEELNFKVEHELVSIDSRSPLIAGFVKYARLRPGFVEIALRYLRIPDQVDLNGMTILHHHASANLPGETDVIFTLMVNCGANANILDKNGLSPVRHLVRRLIQPEGINLPTLVLGTGIRAFAKGGADLLKVSPDGTTLFDDLSTIANKSPSGNSSISPLWSNQKSVDLKARLQGKRHPENELYLAETEVSETSLSHLFEDRSAYEVCYWAENFPNVFDEMLTLEKYLEQGGEIDQVGQAGTTFLWAAFHVGNLRTFEQLLTRGANVDHRLTGNLADFQEKVVRNKSDIFFDGFFGVRGETVLLAACSYPYRRKEFIRPILALTKNVNQTDELGRNGLHRLLYHPLLEGQEECLVDLIRAKVNVNAQTISGATPCHVAVAMNPAVIPALVVSGADPSIRNMRNQTVEDLLRQAIQEGWSRQKEYQEVLDWLTTRKK